MGNCGWDPHREDEDCAEGHEKDGGVEATKMITCPWRENAADEAVAGK